jgi:hypothetical protein
MSKSLASRAPQKPGANGQCLVAVDEHVYRALRARAIMQDVPMGQLVKELLAR